eukprot:gene4927-8524_t
MSTQNKDSKIVLGYWKIRGLASPIRFLLAILKINFKQELYEEKLVDGKWSKTEWFDVKSNLGLDFPNLPYIIDGDIKMTHATAILRYIARKYGLVCKTEEEQIRVEMVEQEGRDFGGSFTRLCYNPNSNEDSKDSYFQKEAPVYLDKFERFLGERKYFAGDSMSHADIFLFDLLDQMMCVHPKLLENHKNLQRFYNQFNEMEQVQAFRKDSNYIAAPLNNPHAKVNNKF